MTFFGVPVWACALVLAALAPLAVRALASAMNARVRERAADVVARARARDRDVP